MYISSLVNTDLGNLNDSSLILKKYRLSMYSTIYTFLKFTSPIDKKKLTHFLIKAKAFFQSQGLTSSAKKKDFWVSSVKAYLNW